MSEEELKKILLEERLLTLEELKKAIEESKKIKRPLEKIILDMHLVEKHALYKIVAKRMGAEYKSLDNLEVSEELLNIYPEDLARSTKSVPLYIENDILHIAMEDPQDVSLIDQIQLFTNYPLEVYFSSSFEIEEAINRIYKKREDIFTQLEELRIEEGKPLSETTSIVKIVDLIIAQAARDRASDIHIEPEENVTRLRFSIDGVLHELPPPPKEWEAAMISRIKVLAGMDIAESRIPQDGHFQMKVDDKVIDFRVSTLPTIHGENVVLRLLDTASITIGLERLGFTTYEDLKRYEDLIKKPYGIILSTGPTGCGKTTTLYSALMRINTPDRNIITLEDPVEYRLGLIRQVQVNPKAGITFANGLRAILRQDPDVIMVGEIRDLETARMAVQAALTGHLVFSTLHTNDAPSAVARLVDMGVENFLVAASLIGIMAQRLVRVICPNCKEAYQPSKAVLKRWGLEGKENVVVYRGRGCPECKGTGFRGRTGMFELMVVDDELREMINQAASTVALRKKAQEKGMQLLWEDGREKVLRGITTFEEVARVCEEQVELKPVKVEVKPHVTIKEEIMKVKKPQEVKVDTHALEEYQRRIARWLSGKK
ncbi:MAG: type II secretion system protein GspE [Candidatus Omnitrophota bacterium]|nr:MAG: type II secretion system protein GspE [Candidatus Omnitrophota bacterium]